MENLKEIRQKRYFPVGRVSVNNQNQAVRIGRFKPLYTLSILLMIYGVVGALYFFPHNIMFNPNSQNISPYIIEDNNIEICDCIKKIKKDGRWMINNHGIKVYIGPRYESVRQICPKLGLLYTRKLVG